MKLDPNKPLPNNPIFTVEKHLGLTDFVWVEENIDLDEFEGKLLVTAARTHKHWDMKIGVFHSTADNKYFWLHINEFDMKTLAETGGFDSLDAAKAHAENFYWEWIRAKG